MILETKFDLEQVVVPIKLGGQDTFIPCTGCNGKGVWTIKETGNKIKCTKCYGHKGTRKWVGDKWFVDSENISSIGMITVKFGYGACTEYMISKTGIGSGRIWKEEHLFETVDDATAECERLNFKGGAK